MGDKMNLLLFIFVGVVVIGAAIYYYMLPRGDDVRKIDAAHQERKAKGATARPTVAKTAQLSALRERLADAQTTTTGLKKLPAKSVEAPPQPVEKSWRPEEAGLGDPLVVAPEPAVHKPTVVKPSALHPSESMPVRPMDSLPSLNPVGGLQEATPAKIIMRSSEPPIAPSPAAAQPQPEKTVEPIAALPVEEARVHILLVDDSKVVRVKTEKLLANKGYKVTTAVDGIDALAKLESLRPAIIITDIEMPNLDGFGLVRNVRGNLRTSEIPVIVMTSHVNLHLDIAATEGINGFLPKPFNDQDLLDQVAFLCES